MNGPAIDAMQAVVATGIGWLERQLDSSGRFIKAERELSAYYKSLLAFAVCGRIEAGAKSLRRVREDLNDNGALASNGGKSKSAIVRMARNLANYMDGWVAIGAWLLGDYGLAEAICTRLERDQNPRHGGILTGPANWSGAERYDLSTAASCGRAFLIAGHRGSAVAAGDFLISALSHQHDSSTGLDLSFDRDWNVMPAPNADERTYYRFDLTKHGEKVWFPAFSSAFLVELWQVSHEGKFLAAAEDYFDFIARSPEYQKGTIANGKSGWAAGLLADATSKPEYARALDMVVPNVLARQLPDGEFAESPAAKRPSAGASKPNVAETAATRGRRLERTAEFTMWVAEYLRHYSGAAVTP